jgi:hypothetical protein
MQPISAWMQQAEATVQRAHRKPEVHDAASFPERLPSNDQERVFFQQTSDQIR